MHTMNAFLVRWRNIRGDTRLQNIMRNAFGSTGAPVIGDSPAGRMHSIVLLGGDCPLGLPQGRHRTVILYIRATIICAQTERTPKHR